MKIDITTTIDGIQIQDIGVIANIFETQIKNSLQGLDKIAEIIKTGIEYNLTSGLTFEGGAVSPLKQSTIKQKGHARSFFNSGELFKSVRKEKVGMDEYNIFINGNRSTIASVLQEGRKDMSERPFFGVGGIMEKNIDEFLNAKLEIRNK